MRQFASSGFRIWNLSLEAKLVYTAFCVLSVAALAVSVLLYDNMVGRGSDGLSRYYRGASETRPREDKRPSGPQIAVDESEPSAPIAVAVSYRKLLEVTH